MHHLIGSLLLAQDMIWDFPFGLFYIVGTLLLIGLIVVYFVIKNKKEED